MVGGRSLIKRIILRCKVLQRSCPLGPRLTTVMKPIPVGGEGGRASEEVQECRTEKERERERQSEMIKEINRHKHRE